MRNIIKFCREKSISFPSDAADVIATVDPSAFGAKEGQAISTLWADQGIQTAFSRSSEYQLFDSAK